ncbi:hypothetical protein CC86DRAFT_439329 [Ophiobolus disseminans]|uniref:Xylanolytic transcriptional activator regulatory domain-containing protein n=1 Tax=Ophiobolus disseminans TaxID=1469910 RepID=A0A6A7A4Q2_9PLEO|nr:hypothetical protein CC86DRAFT_439329 [Ophiobolus disseminans]
MAIQVSGDRLLDLYYANSWPPFPTTLPHRRLRARLQSNPEHGLGPLLAVLQWYGAIYASWTSSDPYYEAALQALQQPATSPFNVQALMLFAVAQHQCDKRESSRGTMDLAVSMALQLHMNEKDFARAYGEGDVVLEESWRRTYYFLYNFDQEFAIITRGLGFVTMDVPIMVDLPCDDEAYESGEIPIPATWKDYQSREFEDVEIVFSSIAYKHDLNTFITDMMKAVQTGGGFDETLVDTVDAKIASWQALLPVCKKDPMRMDGTVDEVMFQCHSSAAILMTIHRPFSVLTYSMEEFSTESFMVLVPFMSNSFPRRAAHTARALRALDIYTKLLAIPSPHEKHSILAMSIAAQFATLQISVCRNLLEDRALDIGRDRLRLMIGFLNTLGMYWPLGKRMAKEIKAIAKAAFLDAQERTQVDSNAEVELTRDEIVWPIHPSTQIDIYAGTVLPMDWNAISSGYASSNSSMYNTSSSSNNTGPAPPAHMYPGSSSI